MIVNPSIFTIKRKLFEVLFCFNFLINGYQQKAENYMLSWINLRDECFTVGLSSPHPKVQLSSILQVVVELSKSTALKFLFCTDKKMRQYKFQQDISGNTTQFICKCIILRISPANL